MRQRDRWLSRLIATASLAALLLPVGGAQAALLFDNGTGNFTSFRNAATNPPLGAGQGIAVSTTTNLTNIAVDLAMPAGGDVKFLIFNSTNSTLLLSTPAEALPASGSPAYVQSPNFGFTLNPGNTYYFGVIGDNDIDINFYVTPPPLPPNNQNGLDALLTGNSNYDNFASPVLATANPFGGGEMTLRLSGTQAVPAPLIGRGLPVLLAVGGMLFGAKLLERRGKRRSLGAADPHAA
jgi:hypothetical protein